MSQPTNFRSLICAAALLAAVAVARGGEPGNTVAPSAVDQNDSRDLHALNEVRDSITAMSDLLHLPRIAGGNDDDQSMWSSIQQRVASYVAPNATNEQGVPVELAQVIDDSMAAHPVRARLESLLQRWGIVRHTPQQEAAAMARDAVGNDVLRAAYEEMNTTPVHPTRFRRMDAFLKWAGIRDRTALETAAQEYEAALRSIQAEYGVDEHSRGNSVAANMGDRLSYMLQWLRAHNDTATLDAADISVLEGMRNTWDRMVTDATTSVIQTRDDAAAAWDQTLKRTGMRDRTTAEKAHDRLEQAGRNLLVALGMRSPTVRERLGARAQQAPAARSVLDRTLKALHIRDKSSMDKAMEAYDAAMHKAKVTMHMEDPTTSERVSGILASTRTKLHDITSQLTSSASNTARDASTGAHDAYDAASAAAYNQLQALRESTDAALKQAGIRDKTVSEKVADNMRDTWHSMMLSMGVHEPTWRDRVHDASSGAHFPASSSSNSGSGGVLDRTLKALHIRDKSSMDKAMEAYDAAMHKAKVTMHMEDPTTSERVSGILASTRAKLHDITSQLTSSASNTARDASTGAHDAYDAASAAAYNQLQALRASTDAALKQAGIKDANVLSMLQRQIDDAFLHTSSPTVHENVPHTHSRVDAALLHRYAQPNSLWRRTMRMLGLQRSSAAELARDEYIASLKSLQNVVNPHASSHKRAGNTLARIEEALELVPATVAAHAVLDTQQGAVDTQDLHTLDAATMETLLRLRDSMSSFMRHDVNDCCKDEYHRMEESMHSLWVSLGYSKPSWVGRMRELLGRALGPLGTWVHSDTAKHVEMAIDAASGLSHGDASNSGLFARLKRGLMGL